MKKWNTLSLDDKSIYKLADDLNVSIEISKLLIKRGITDFDSAKDFLAANYASEVAVENIPDPDEIEDKSEDNANDKNKANDKSPVNRRLLRWSPPAVYPHHHYCNHQKQLMILP